MNELNNPGTPKRMLPILFSMVTLLSLATIDARAADTVRQRTAVTVDGQPEEWRLTWSGPVKPACAATQLEEAMSCPCTGFAYGEQGRLYLERQRAGAAAERLNLSTLFDGDYDTPVDNGNAILPRILRGPTDPLDRVDNPAQARSFARALTQRPPADVMALADFPHDGMKATFLLQVGNEPCGKREMALIGVSRRLPHLHAFTSTAHPERPLILQNGAWKALLATPARATFTDLACGDHGSENEVEQIIAAHDGTFSVKTNTYTCQNNGKRGRLVHSAEL